VSRRKARELALSVLFQVDLAKADVQTALFEAFTRDLESDESVTRLNDKDAEFCKDLVEGAWERREALDGTIVSYAKDWSVDRMPTIDRNILRLAVYEIKHRDEVPDSVAADEAVELAKIYSTDESPKFINGILGSVIRGLAAAGGAQEG
jgi:transcription antitermination protein NusB